MYVVRQEVNHKIKLTSNSEIANLHQIAESHAFIQVG